MKRSPCSKMKASCSRLQNTCPHEGGQLSAGWIEDGAVVCPLHGYKFDLTNGACATDAKLKVKIFKLARKARTT